MQNDIQRGQASRKTYVGALLVFVVVVGLGAGGLWSYATFGRQEYDAGASAYRAGNCTVVMASLERVTGLFKLVPGLDIQDASAKMEECRQFVPAENLQKENRHSDLVTHYEGFIALNPKSALVPFAQEAASQSYSGWATQLRNSDQYDDAIKKYQVVATTYAATSLARQTDSLIAETYADWAKYLRKQENYQAAIEKYQVVQSQYAKTPTGAQTPAAMAETLSEWATQLRKDGRCEDAIGKYQIILNQYSDTPTGAQTKAAIAETYGEWALQLRQTGKYADAIDKYSTILRSYADTPIGKQATQFMIDTYGEWGAAQRKLGNYENAIAEYQIIITINPNAPEASAAQKTVFEIYNDWGKALAAQGKFIAALDKYNTVKKGTKDAELLAAADKGYTDALTGLSQDTGADGKQVMDAAYTDVLAGKPASSPAIGMAKNEPGKAVFKGAEFTLPTDLQATKPGHFLYVISLKSDTTEVERCSYTGQSTGANYTVVRQQQTWRVTIRDTRTAAVVVEQTFNGSAPAICPNERQFTIGVSTYYQPGGVPSGNDVISWLRTIVR